MKSYHVVFQTFFCIQLILHFRVQFSQGLGFLGQILKDPNFSGSSLFSVWIQGLGPSLRSSCNSVKQFLENLKCHSITRAITLNNLLVLILFNNVQTTVQITFPNNITWRTYFQVKDL